MQSSSGEETLELVRLDVSGSFNSFRIPSGIKYHRTFYIPTKTTLIGLLGSALGFEDSALEPFFRFVRTNAILEGYSGLATDLWLITKLKTQGQPELSPIVREMIFEPRYSIYYSIENGSPSPDHNNNLVLDDIINAFNDPVFALSLGRSDEIIQVRRVAKISVHKQSSDNDGDYYFRNTILPFNYNDHFEKYDTLPLRKGQTFSLPQVISIPTYFYIEDGFVRRPLHYKQVTLVYDRGVKIKNREDVLIHGEKRFFIY
jgi:CRISPR-associated Cas5-like protein